MRRRVIEFVLPTLRGTALAPRPRPSDNHRAVLGRSFTSTRKGEAVDEVFREAYRRDNASPSNSETMKVRLDREFVMPKQCACCLAPASSVLKTTQSRPGTVDGFRKKIIMGLSIPYCATVRGPCTRHRNLARSAQDLRDMDRARFRPDTTLVGGGVAQELSVVGSRAGGSESIRGFAAVGGSSRLPRLRDLAPVFLARRRPYPVRPAARLVSFWDDEIHLDVHNPEFAKLLKEAQWVPMAKEPSPVPARAEE